MKKPVVLASLPLLAFIAANAAADPMFDCGMQTIQSGVGTTKEQVLASCGKPSSEDGNRWFYTNQEGGKTVILHFDGGTVSLIQEQIVQ